MAYTLANGSSPVSAPRLHRRKNAYRRISVNRSGFRFYHSGIGRWMSRDPMENTREWVQLQNALNSYAFIDNDPLNYVDLLGFMGFKQAPKWPTKGPYNTPEVLEKIKEIVDFYKQKVNEYRSCHDKGKADKKHRDRIQNDFCNPAKSFIDAMKNIIANNPTLTEADKKAIQTLIDLVQGPYSEWCPAPEKLPQPQLEDWRVPECPCPAPSPATIKTLTWATAGAILLRLLLLIPAL